MTIIGDPVQVQLVNAWWEQIIPVAAFLISLFSVALTLAFRFRDRLQLEVTTSWSYMLDSDMKFVEGEDRVEVRVTNKSPNFTTEISGLTLQLAGGNNFAYTDPGPGDDALPKTLGPGQSAALSYAARGLGITLNTGAKSANWVRGRAVSGHKTVVGKRRRGLVRDLRAYAVKHPYESRWHSATR